MQISKVINKNKYKITGKQYFFESCVLLKVKSIDMNNNNPNNKIHQKLLRIRVYQQHKGLSRFPCFPSEKSRKEVVTIATFRNSEKIPPTCRVDSHFPFMSIATTLAFFTYFALKQMLQFSIWKIVILIQIQDHKGFLKTHILLVLNLSVLLDLLISFSL